MEKKYVYDGKEGEIVTRVITKTEFRRNIGKYIRIVQKETIIVTYRREPKWVLMSAHEFDSLIYKKHGLKAVKS